MLLFKYRKIIILLVILLLAGCFLFSSTVDASLVPCGKTSGTTKEMKPCTLCHLIVGIDRIIDWGFKILTFVAIAALVAAGIIYIISAGNEKLMETAKNFAKYTLAGFAIVLGAWLIVNYTMILLSKESDLGIGIISWSEFNCETDSDLGKTGSDDPSCIPLGGNCSRESSSPSCCEGACQLTPVVGSDGVTVMIYTCKE